MALTGVKSLWLGPLGYDPVVYVKAMNDQENDTIKVSCCYDAKRGGSGRDLNCPFVNHEHNTCDHEEWLGRDLTRAELGGSPPPEWCPLRSRPTTVELAS